MGTVIIILLSKHHLRHPLTVVFGDTISIKPPKTVIIFFPISICALQPMKMRHSENDAFPFCWLVHSHTQLVPFHGLGCFRRLAMMDWSTHCNKILKYNTPTVSSNKGERRRRRRRRKKFMRILVHALFIPEIPTRRNWLIGSTSSSSSSLPSPSPHYIYTRKGGERGI